MVMFGPSRLLYSKYFADDCPFSEQKCHNPQRDQREGAGRGGNGMGFALGRTRFCELAGRPFFGHETEAIE
jgi:hypothetical protein